MVLRAPGSGASHALQHPQFGRKAGPISGLFIESLVGWRSPLEITGHGSNSQPSVAEPDFLQIVRYPGSCFKHRERCREVRCRELSDDDAAECHCQVYGCARFGAPDAGASAGCCCYDAAHNILLFGVSILAYLFIACRSCRFWATFSSI